jgi:hypothetical protein
VAGFANFTRVSRRRGLILALLAALLAPAAAHASAYSDVLKTYQLKGSIPPCQYSSKVLNSALKGVDTYGAQYFADFTNAIQTALDNRASGSCAPRSSLGGFGPTTRGPVGTASLRSLTAPTTAAFPAVILLLALLAGVAVLATAAGAIVVARGWDPAPAAVWRHAWQEAGYRFGGTWAEFRDWLHSA